MELASLESPLPQASTVPIPAAIWLFVAGFLTITMRGKMISAILK